MKLCGSVKTIEEIEKTIKKTNCARLNRANGDRKFQGGDFKPRIFHRVYWLRLEGYAIAVKVKLTFDYRPYDYRGNVSEVEIRDDRVWLVVAKVPQLAELFCGLAPFFTQSQFYAHKHRHSEFLRTMDRLLE